MKKVLSLLLVLGFISLAQFATQAQTAGSIGGTVVDPTGAVVPNATVAAKGLSGKEFTANTSENGTYRIPAVPSGIYSVSVTAKGFKTTIATNVKVDAGVPSTVDLAVEPGSIQESVVVASGAEILQTQTAAVTSTIVGRQITETPIASRDALDLVGLLPGTATVGRPRAASINGLPKGSLSITIDGVDVQDNLLRSSDGYFTYVRPRIDAIEEVTVSTATPGAESSGDGAVQIKFITKRGTNDYHGGLFWQHRNTALNANYWFNNRDRLPKNQIQLNQYGGRFGGALPFPKFGIGGRSVDSGKGKAFFFVNYEEFRQPESLNRTRVVLNPNAQLGNFSYIVNGVTQTRNVYTIAAANGQLSTPDPTVAALLTKIRTAAETNGTFTPITNDPNRQNYNFTPKGGQVRKFLALRFDVNVTKNHSVEFVTNRQRFVPSKDFLNSQDERFPGFPAYTQGSFRNSYSAALRSTLTRNVVNEARYAVSSGLSEFSPGIAVGDYGFQGGYDLGIGAAGVTTATSRNSYSNRNTPTYDLTDTVTWLKGNHSFSFGGQYKLIKATSTSIGRIVPSIAFGLDSTEGTAFSMFAATAASLPGASAAQLTEARNLYATLVGRISGFTATAYLSDDGGYKLHAPQTRKSEQNTYGLFVQDSWRMRPTLTVNYGIRWQPQTAFKVLSDNYAKTETYDQVFGLSGKGNLFKPGTLTGSVPRVIAAEIGEEAYPSDMDNLAPSVGVVWSPNFGDSGLLRSIAGESGKSVFRGGYSVSFVREGFDLLGSILGSNPGGSLSASRSLAIGNMTVGTNLRTPGNPNLTPAAFSATPAYPITLTTANSTNVFDPNLKTGKVHSFSIGYQRELDQNTVVEFRYVGNRGVGLQRQYNLNEFNTIENGFADEFKLAQANLYANIAAGRGASFAYFGAGTGTSPLPIALSYFNTAATFDPNNPARYSATNFANTTLVAALSRNAPSIGGFGSGANYENNAARRANAIANGRPINFFYVNPTTGVNGTYTVDNSSKTWYDSGIIEVRRRMSTGLRFQASYVWSKAQSNAYASSSVVYADFTQREGGLKLAKNVQAFDLPHQFKFDATYDLPFGNGRKFFSGANWLANGFVGGWTLLPTIRWQSGSPFSLGNVQLVGMTRKDLQKEIKVRKGPNVVTYLPDDIILNTQKAFNIDVTNTANGGYGTTFGTGGPTGRFIAPAGYGNCLSRYAGECGFNNLIVYGPKFFKFDVTLAKKVMLGESRNLEFRATFLDALNHANFRVGGWAADTVGITAFGNTFGQLGSTTAYQDISTTNDPGGRLIDLMVRLNF
ncbi:MAG TPA: carboxypeptidase regulatory-like domain-containing protein [Pyrinomonadaceae bacterium]|nr:carboxypeptidase regulatory-like domain-containing protein [Pyrinomonadaceae bacterium]